jgi:hypothetical protein
MKPSLIAFGLASTLLVIPALAAADEDALAPPPRTGFQMALRTGYMVPFGQATGAAGDDMGNLFSGQVPLIVDIGGKPTPSFFLGGYVGLGFGGAAGITANLCNALQETCVTASLRLGIEGLLYFAPETATNPWVGYGIGLESTALSGSANGQTSSVGVAGWEYGHLMGGVDFRISRTIGIGPIVDFSFGQYNHETVQTPGQQQHDVNIVNAAMHEWLLIGGRVVFFP